jgi:magnesium transporter
VTGVRDQPSADARQAARTRLYRNGSLALEDFPVANVSDHLSEPDGVIWLDLYDPDESDLARVGEELGLHALAIEDAVQRHQRAKLDHYDGHLFLNVYSASLDRESAELAIAELAVFVTDRALVTVRWPGGFDIDAVLARWDGGTLAIDGIGALLHGILDLVADSHLETVRNLDEELDSLEAQLFEDPEDAGPYRKAARLRRGVSTLRRVTLPMREIVAGLLNRDQHLLDDGLLPYFHDVQDHAVHAAQWADSLRDITTTIRENHLNIQSNQLNQVMKKVTAWAAIIAVPTAITGFYGQNIPYPGFGQPWGFWISTAAICALSGGLYASFKRRDWI